MEWQILVILFASTFFAAIVHGITGFAFSIVLLMILPRYFNYSDTIAIIGILCVITLIYNTAIYREHIVWKHIPIALISFSIGDFLAICILKTFGESPLWYKLMGIVFCMMGIYLLKGQDVFKIKATRVNSILFNGISGLVTGLFAIGGPISCIYFLAVTKSKEEYMATVQMMFTITISVDVLLRVLNGMIYPRLFILGVSCVFFIIAGLLVGKRILNRINLKLLNILICILMLVNAVYMFQR